MTRQYHEFYSELDHMVQDLAREHGVAYPLSPWTAREGHTVHVGGEENYRKSLAWRKKLVAEIEARPDWVARWRKQQALDRRIEELCTEKGLAFSPHECPPWQAPDELPRDFKPSPGLGWDLSLPEAVRLRRRLIAEIKAEKRF